MNQIVSYLLFTTNLQFCCFFHFCCLSFLLVFSFFRSVTYFFSSWIINLDLRNCWIRDNDLRNSKFSWWPSPHHLENSDYHEYFKEYIPITFFTGITHVCIEKIARAQAPGRNEELQHLSQFDSNIRNNPVFDQTVNNEMVQHINQVGKLHTGQKMPFIEIFRDSMNSELLWNLELKYQ